MAQCSRRYVTDDWKERVRFQSQPLVHPVTPHVQLITFGKAGTCHPCNNGIAVVLQGIVNNGGRGSTTIDPLVAQDNQSAVVVLSFPPPSFRGPLVFG